MDNVQNESKKCAFLILYFLLHLSDSTVQAMMYTVVQIWPGQTVICFHTNRPGHIWTTLYTTVKVRKSGLLGDWVDLDFRIFWILKQYF